MKTSFVFPCIIAIFILAFATSCEKTIDLPNVNTPEEPAGFDKIQPGELSPPPEDQSSQIRFDIQITDCYAGSQSLEIIIDSPNLYSFLWEVDNSYAGHGRSLECVCGETARVRVMGLADGESVYRTVDLLPCEVDDSF